MAFKLRFLTAVVDVAGMLNSRAESRVFFTSGSVVEEEEEEERRNFAAACAVSLPSHEACEVSGHDRHQSCSNAVVPTCSSTVGTSAASVSADSLGQYLSSSLSSS